MTRKEGAIMESKKQDLSVQNKSVTEVKECYRYFEVHDGDYHGHTEVSWEFVSEGEGFRVYRYLGGEDVQVTVLEEENDELTDLAEIKLSEFVEQAIDEVVGGKYKLVYDALYAKREEAWKYGGAYLSFTDAIGNYIDDIDRFRDWAKKTIKLNRYLPYNTFNMGKLE